MPDPMRRSLSSEGGASSKRDWKMRLSLRSRSQGPSGESIPMRGRRCASLRGAAGGAPAPAESGRNTPNAQASPSPAASPAPKKSNWEVIEHFSSSRSRTRSPTAGTNARPRDLLEQQMESTGAMFDCTTTRDMANYRVHCLADTAPLCFDLLTDCVFNNSYSEADITRERNVVAAEMMKHDRNPAALVDDYLHLTAFQGCPLGQTIMGPSSNLCNFDAMTISRYMNKFFDSRRTVVSVVGGVKHEEMVSLATTYLSKLEPSKCLDKDVYRFTASEIRFRNDDLPAALVALAVEAPCICDEERLALEVACEVLGGWDSSQGAGHNSAWELARYASVNGLALAFRSFYLTYKDTGLFGVKFLSGRMELGDMQMAVQKVLLGLVHLVTDMDVQRAKRVLKTKMLSRDMDVAQASADAGRAMLYAGRHNGLAARVAAVDAISTDHVRKVCDLFLDDRSPVISAVGPTETLDDYTRIASLMYWLRN